MFLHLIWSIMFYRKPEVKFIFLIILASLFTVVTTNTRPQRVFSSVQTCVLVDVNQLLPQFFMRWPREGSFSVSWALWGICRRFSRFCNILLQHLAPLHVEITRRKNLLSVSRRKLKLSIYLHTVSYNHISFLNRSQLVWVLTSSSFYSITWRMISSKIHFRKQPPFRGNFFPFRCDIFCFFEFILASWQFSRPRLPCFHTSN